MPGRGSGHTEKGLDVLSLGHVEVAVLVVYVTLAMYEGATLKS